MRCAWRRCVQERYVGLHEEGVHERYMHEGNTCGSDLDLYVGVLLSNRIFTCSVALLCVV